MVRPLAAPGRSGTVYEALGLDGDGRLALKVLDAGLGDDAAFRDRFRDDVIKQGSLHHPHIVPVYEAGESEQGLFVAMAKVDGPNLSELIADGALDPARALAILAPIGDALDAAHAAGLVHGNLKPQNIVVLPGDRDAGEHSLLTDFGSAPLPDRHGLMTSSESVDSVAYISPEQARNEAANPRSDLYALGAVLFEVLTGTPPFPRDSATAVLYAHLYRPVPVASERESRLSGEVDRVLGRAMAKDPADRYESAVAMLAAAADALKSVVDADGAGLRPPGTPAPGPSPAVPAPADETPTGSRPVVGSPGRAGESGDDNGGGPALVRREPPVAVPATEERAGPADAVEAPDRVRREREAPARPYAATRPAAPAPIEVSEPRRSAAIAAEPVEHGRRGRGLLIGTLAILALALAAAAAALLAPGRDAPTPPPPRAEASERLRLDVPGTWRRLASAPAIPGLRLSDAIAVAPPATARSGLVIGTSRASGAVLLPAGFLRRLSQPPRRDDTVRLGRLQAYRYAGLSPRGFDGTLTAYAVPTTAGVVTAACFAPAPEGVFLAQCERVASTLRLTGARPVPLGPDRRYATRLDRAIGRLNAARAGGRARLQGARTPAGQAQTAEALAAAYGAAAQSLSRARLNPAERQANRRIVAALQATQAAYLRMGAGARAGDRGVYNFARAAVLRREADVQRAVESLEALGYLLT